jgi:flagellar motility protein MotE (MotC chaperone)
MADIVGSGKMSLRVFITVVACGFAVAALPLRGQTSVDPNPTPDNTTTRDATRVISTPEVKENISPTSTDSTRPSNLAARSALSPEVKERLRNFERAREAYLQRQRELEKRLKGATEQERERIREMIKDRRAAWEEQHRQLQAELRDRVREMKRTAIRDALDETRPGPTRPGTD